MEKDKRMKRKIEILAPAGSFESFYAAINAGADAVYAGGPCFGARAFAGNFTEEELLSAIDYAHLHGRKFYLTVNTLLKDEEMEKLYAYLAPLYVQGLDAVIVQDIGVLDFVRTHFPDMAIHASTQMTITNVEGARFLEELGVERVVPARELSLPEVRDIAEKTGLEVECFVHGALCYCYSGQCLLSSMIGGRSGNRGQCAQPCRLPYSLPNDASKKYWLSLKDICTLEQIPSLVEAGIDSFKIEGRMKKPEYVALVTSMYRKYVDKYLENGRESFSVESSDIEKLMDIYNRGGFSGGYYRQHNGRDMLSLERPNHAGVQAVRVLSQNGREITGEALTRLWKGDVLELAWESKTGEKRRNENARAEMNHTLGNDVERGEKVRILLPKGRRCQKGISLYRIRSQKLLEEIQKRYETEPVRESIVGTISILAGRPARLQIRLGDISVSAESEEVVQRAQNRPIEKERVKKQLQKTGNTEFVFERLEVEMDKPVFLPVQQLNELRRTALERLREAVCGKHRRELLQLTGTPANCKRKLPEQNEQVETASLQSRIHFYEDRKEETYLAVLAETMEQFAAALECETVCRIYVEGMMLSDLAQEKGAALCKEAVSRGKEIYLAMPHIFREKAVQFYRQYIPVLLRAGFHGILVRNYESYTFLMEQRFDKPVILDHNLYVYNQEAKNFWHERGIDSFTAPLELNGEELRRLGIHEAELVLYGRIPVMVSAQCVINNAYGCAGKPGILKLKDRLGKQFPVRNCCQFCYNIIYNESPLCLFNQREAVKRLAPCGVRVQFSTETKEEAAQILRQFEESFLKENSLPDGMEYTRGHFRRGVT